MAPVRRRRKNWRVQSRQTGQTGRKTGLAGVVAVRIEWEGVMGADAVGGGERRLEVGVAVLKVGVVLKRLDVASTALAVSKK